MSAQNHIYAKYSLELTNVSRNSLKILLFYILFLFDKNNIECSIFTLKFVNVIK